MQIIKLTIEDKINKTDSQIFFVRYKLVWINSKIARNSNQAVSDDFISKKSAHYKFLLRKSV